jgi:hypothetical protein
MRGPSVSEYTIFVPSEPVGDAEMPSATLGMWRDARDDTAWSGALVRRAVRFAKAQALREAADDPVLTQHTAPVEYDAERISAWLRQRADELEAKP